MIGVQAEGAASMVQGRDIDQPATVATAIQIGRPVNRPFAQEAVDVSQGWFFCVSDEQILEAQSQLARQGVFVEPASATPWAGLMALWERREVPDVSTIVLVFTGNGLKDPKTPLLHQPLATTSWDGKDDGVLDALVSA